MDESSEKDRTFETAREHSIEVYDEKFQRNSILTRSARVRKFKFYQYKPLKTKSITDSSISPKTPEPAVLVPREDVLQGKVPLIAEQSEELSDLDKQIFDLEKEIADLNGKSDINGCNLDEIFKLVNQKNDLLRRQMQLNILEQEKVLEKANDELTKELRALMSKDDSKKTQDELDRQQYLYDQSLALVEKRNQLVHYMDVQEKGIEDDNALKATLRTVMSDAATRSRLDGQDQNCCIQ